MLNWLGKCLLPFHPRLSPHPPSFSQSNMFETRKGKRGDGGWMEMEGKKKKGKEGSLAMTAKRRRIPLVFFRGIRCVCVSSACNIEDSFLVQPPPTLFPPHVVGSSSIFFAAQDIFPSEEKWFGRLWTRRIERSPPILHPPLLSRGH